MQGNLVNRNPLNGDTVQTAIGKYAQVMLHGPNQIAPVRNFSLV